MAIRLQYPCQTFAAALTSFSLALLLDPGQKPLQQSDVTSVLYDAVVFLVFFLGLFNRALSLLNIAEEKLSNIAKTWFLAVSGTTLVVAFSMRLWISAVSVSAFCASSLVFLAAAMLILGGPLLSHLYCKRGDSVSVDKEQI